MKRPRLASGVALMIGIHLALFALALALTFRAAADDDGGRETANTPAASTTASTTTPATPVAVPPSRAVVVGGGLTEIVYALGVESALVGVDTKSTHPAAATALPQVGYLRSLSAEGVLSLTPDVVFAVDSAGPPAVLEQIESAGVRVDTLPSEPTLEAVLARVRTLAERFDRRSEGQALVREIETEMAAARAAAERADPPPRAAFLLGTGAGDETSGESNGATTIERAGDDRSP